MRWGRRRWWTFLYVFQRFKFTRIVIEIENSKIMKKITYVIIATCTKISNRKTNQSKTTQPHPYMYQRI